MDSDSDSLPDTSNPAMTIGEILAKQKIKTEAASSPSASTAKNPKPNAPKPGSQSKIIDLTELSDEDDEGVQQALLASMGKS